MRLEGVSMTPDEFCHATSVSRETLERLKVYESLLQKWNKRINLVGPTTLQDPWRRHFLDSVGLLSYLPPIGAGKERRIIDLGSGAGFPGLVLALLGAGEVHLVESDHRKAIFLQEAARLTETAVTIHAERLEKLTPFPIDVITARAFAPLSKILDYMRPFLTLEGEGPPPIGVFLKGEDVESELTEASKNWKMTEERFKSQSDPRGVILRLSHIELRSSSA